MIQNQKDTLERLAKIIGDGVVVMHGSTTQYRNADTWHPFRQDSNFHYLTAWPEPEAHAIIKIDGGNYELFLFHKTLDLTCKNLAGQNAMPGVDRTRHSRNPTDETSDSYPRGPSDWRDRWGNYSTSN